jgi:hypothetical protein
MKYKELQQELKQLGATIPLNSPKAALEAEYNRLALSSASSAIVHFVHSPVHSPSKPLEALAPDFEVVASARKVKLTEYVNIYMDTGDDIPIYTQCWLTVEGYAATCTRLPERVRQHLGSDTPILGKVYLNCAVKRDRKVYESCLHVANITPTGIEITVEARCELNPEEVRDIEKLLSKRFCLYNRVLLAHAKAGKSEDRVSSRKKTARKMKF